MTVKKVWAVYFSGTGTTKKTVDRIAHRLAEALGTDCEVYDYTLPAARRQELTIPSGDVAVVGCPTYAGRVPNLLMPYLRDMVHGEGALAVPVVLFGNRNYDDALMELSQLLTADGFSCVAGGAFVGEHSFSRTLGAGRPSGADVGEMDAFAEHVAAKLVAGDTAPVTVGGCDPIRPYYTPRDRHGEPINILKVKPKTDMTNAAAAVYVLPGVPWEVSTRRTCPGSTECASSAVPVSRAVPAVLSISMTPGIYTTRANWRSSTPVRQRTRCFCKYQRGRRWE